MNYIYNIYIIQYIWITHCSDCDAYTCIFCICRLHVFLIHNNQKYIFDHVLEYIFIIKKSTTI